MRIYKTEITSGTLDISELFEITGKEMGNIKLNVGVATFPDGLRHPRGGMSAHDQDEISIILNGKVLLETQKGYFSCETGDVIHIPAGEEHASIAIDKTKVFYVLFG